MKLKSTPKKFLIICVSFLLVSILIMNVSSYLIREKAWDDLILNHGLRALTRNQSSSFVEHHIYYEPNLTYLKKLLSIGQPGTVSHISYNSTESKKSLPESICIFSELHSLTLSNISLTPKEALIIGKLQNLTSIEFDSCDLSPEFCRHFPGNNRLSGIIIDESKVTPDSLSDLLHHTPHLTKLNINKYSHVSELLRNIQSFPLEGLSLKTCLLSEESMLLITNLKTLKRLNLQYDTLPSRSFELLATLPELEVLDLRNTTFSPQELPDLSTSNSLDFISISGQKISSNDLNPLFDIRTLKSLAVVLPSDEPPPKSHKDVNVVIIRVNYGTANE